MEDAADHLAHDVFPAVPVRQWMLSFLHACVRLHASDREGLERLCRYAGVRPSPCTGCREGPTAVSSTG